MYPVLYVFSNKNRKSVPHLFLDAKIEANKSPNFRQEMFLGCFQPRCFFLSLSVSKVTQNRVEGAK